MVLGAECHANTEISVLVWVNEGRKRFLSLENQVLL